MRKIYLSGLILFTFFINSYVVDGSSFAGTSDTAKITHFYPNPATSFINFTFDKSVDKSYTLQVYNFIGKKMTDMRISDLKLTVNFDDNYFRGLYIFQLRDKSGRIVESGKFQVNR